MTPDRSKLRSQGVSANWCDAADFVMVPDYNHIETIAPLCARAGTKADGLAMNFHFLSFASGPT
jgi:hypothetical protein